ncbi:MAG TPA: glycosyl hydrolase [Thermoanaerobaculia bacterium]|nr:glycosyl hydrolase [Thermoanaerobaculia bacterium]
MLVHLVDWQQLAGAAAGRRRAARRAPRAGVAAAVVAGALSGALIAAFGGGCGLAAAAQAPAPAAPATSPGGAAQSPAAPTPGPAGAKAEAPEIDSYSFGGLQARPIGPAATGGRIAAIDAVAEEPLTVYVGSAGGGVWRSRDGGTSFRPVFDEHAQSIGAVAVDPGNSKTVWVGTGESWTRNSVGVGDGIYRSTDGGDHWERLGLERSERIARIQIHPKDGNVVYACVAGHLWDDSEERGVYKTADGGKSWKRILYVNPGTGCSDLAMDPQEPRILYAGMWQFRRYPWAFSSGGPGSGLFKSTDGGDTWKPLAQGLPAGQKGRIAVAIAPSRPAVVYALVESRNTALYRSDDTGETWKEVNSSFNLQVRPFYFSRLVVDPADFNTVYKPGLFLTVSTDGGKTFGSPFSGNGVANGPHSDHHALWINPKNPHQMLLGTDGGVYLSSDRAHTWRYLKALPVSQFYEVSFDMAQPYHVYGGLQDNGSWMAPSRGIDGAVTNQDWHNIGGGDGFYAVSDPADPDVVYVEFQGGHVSRRSQQTGTSKDIQPLPGTGDPELRYNWNTPIALSPTRPGTVYVGSQFLFRSRDRGESWERISPDLTTNDPRKQQQGTSGGLTVDNSSAEKYTTIFAIAESPKDANVIWAGTDDGNLQLTRDGGANWTNVGRAVPGLPAGAWVSKVEAGHRDAATAFVTFDNHHNGDMKTYVYKTVDFGKSWQSLAGTGAAGFAHVVREDLENPDLLFLGTELGLFISLDGGGHWARFSGNLPPVSVWDVAIHPREKDLIIATHGRGIYILDDITPLRRLTRDLLTADLALLPSKPSVMPLPVFVQEFPGDEEFVGPNPEEAASICYYLKKRHILGELKVEVYDSSGKLVSSLPGGKRRGINRVAWPMRLPGPKLPPANSLVVDQPAAFFGPRVPPGTYTVKVTKGDQTYTSEVRLVPDPRSAASDEDRALQNQTVMRLYGMLTDLTYTADAVVDVREQAKQRAAGLAAGSSLRRQLAQLADRLDALHQLLVATKEGGWLSGEEELREKLAGLYGAVNGYEGRPTRSQLDDVKVLAARLDDLSGRIAAVEKSELAQVNRALAAAKGQPIVVMDRKAWESKQEKGGGSAGGPAARLDRRVYDAMPWGLGRLGRLMAEALESRQESD